MVLNFLHLNISSAQVEEPTPKATLLDSGFASGRESGQCVDWPYPGSNSTCLERALR